MESWAYYLWAVLLLLACSVAWLSSLITLPGNWFIAGFVALFAWLVPREETRGIGWNTVAVLLAVAIAGEVIEFVAGAAGAAKQGGSKRGVALAMVGAVVGSIVGITVGLPIPVLGPFIGALFGGAVGAFAGAYLGEAWKGRGHDERIAVGRGAFTGRVWGTAGKLVVGAVMLVIVAWDAFF
jgi:uncharacterized protein YqgC (DUF456 family)